MNYLALIKHFFAILSSFFCLFCLSQSLWSQSRNDTQRRPAPLVILDSDRERDGLRGPVRQVRTEVAKVNLETDGPVEGSRSLLELTVYDISGKRIDNKTYPMVSGPLGQETYEYDEQGHLLMTTVRNAQGVVLRRTEYSYEFDAVGNWIKMTSSVVVSESLWQRYELFEVTYRTIIYYSGGDVEAPARAEEGRAVSPTALTHTGKDSFPQIEPVGNSSKGVPAQTSSTAVGVFAVGAPKGASSQQRLDVSTSESVKTDKLTDVGLINDKALSLPGPAYPINWRKAATPIIVNVEVVIDETGRVIYARALEGPQELRQVTEDAARRAGFLPFRAGRRPFKAKGLLSYSFPFDPQ